jgi:hypothetical protein
MKNCERPDTNVALTSALPGQRIDEMAQYRPGAGGGEEDGGWRLDGQLRIQVGVAGLQSFERQK